MSNTYYTKYLKYKQKYSNLLNELQKGGNQQNQISLCKHECGRIADYFQIYPKEQKILRTLCCSKCDGTNLPEAHTENCNNDHIINPYKTLISIVIRGCTIQPTDHQIPVIILNPGVPTRLINIIKSKIYDFIIDKQHYKTFKLDLHSSLWNKYFVKLKENSEFYNLQQNLGKMIVDTLKNVKGENFINSSTYKNGKIIYPYIDVQGDKTQIYKLSGKQYGYDVLIQ